MDNERRVCRFPCAGTLGRASMLDSPNKLRKIKKRIEQPILFFGAERGI